MTTEHRVLHPALESINLDSYLLKYSRKSKETKLSPLEYEALTNYLDSIKYNQVMKQKHGFTIDDIQEARMNRKYFKEVWEEEK